MVEEIKLEKYFVITFYSPDFDLRIQRVFYKRNGKIFRLHYVLNEDAKRENFLDILGEFFMQLGILGEEHYSPRIIKGVICERSGKEISVKSGRKVYHFEESCKEEIEENKKFSEKFPEIMRSLKTSYFFLR